MWDRRSAYTILVGRPGGKRTLGRHRRKWEDNIKSKGKMHHCTGTEALYKDLQIRHLILYCLLQWVKVKVNVTLVQALRLCTGRTALRWGTCIALPFHDNGTRREEGSESRPGRSLPPGKSRYPLYRRLGGPQGQSGQVRKISPTTGIRSPDRPARCQSLYRLRYPAHEDNIKMDAKLNTSLFHNPFVC